MKREIKFRAFWGAVNQMRHFILGNFVDTNDGWAMSFVLSNDNPDQNIYLGKAEIMQFTGLLDKNGKEIYEGDIVNAIELSIDENFMPTDEILSQRYAEVYFDSLLAGWGLRAEGFERGCIPMTHLDSFEVIGNIYETPEMLNSEQNPERSDATESR